MTEEALRSRVAKAEEQVIFAITRINYLLQIIDLSKENNRIIRRFDGFFAMVARDFVSGAIVAIRGLHEPRSDTHNLNTLIQAVRECEMPDSKRKQLEPVLVELSSILNEEIARKVTILASVAHVHRGLKPPKEEVIVEYVEMRQHLERVGELLNKISGRMWRSGTLMVLPDSEGDRFTKEMRHIEKTEDIGTWMLRLEPGHPVVIRREEFMKKMKNDSVGK